MFGKASGIRLQLLTQQQLQKYARINRFHHEKWDNAMQRLKVLIIGAGRIGALNDLPSSSNVLTHAHAFMSVPGFSLLGFADASKDRAEAAVRRWGGCAGTVDDFFKRCGRIDVVSIASSDESHEAILRGLIGRPVGLVFCEKPLCTTLNEAAAIARAYARRRIPLAVNYSRRFIPEFETLRKRIAAGRYGAFLGGSGRYGKGFVHNGTHLIDMLRFLLGSVTPAKSLCVVRDHTPSDPSRTVMLTAAGGAPFFMMAVHQNCYTIFDTDLYFEKGRITIADSGSRIEESSIVADPVHTGYRILGKPSVQRTSLGTALKHAVRNLRGHLVSGMPLVCTADDAVEAIRICTRLT